MYVKFPGKLVTCISYENYLSEIKLDINLLSKTNKYKTKQTNQKYQKERQKPNMNAPFINLT
jgi:hypothetical protein